MSVNHDYRCRARGTRVVCLLMSAIVGGWNLAAAEQAGEGTPDFDELLSRIEPLTPAEALASFEVDGGLGVQLAAAEPKVADPMNRSLSRTAGRISGIGVPHSFSGSPHGRPHEITYGNRSYSVGRDAARLAFPRPGSCSSSRQPSRLFLLFTLRILCFAALAWLARTPEIR